MTVKTDINGLIRARLADAWPGTMLVGDPTPLTGGFWASMYRVELKGQPSDVPGAAVFRIAPDEAMGAKECAVQQTVANQGYRTPQVRLNQPHDPELGGAWSVMDFATGVPPLGNLNGIAALRSAPKLFARLPVQLAASMAALHALDPEPTTAAIRAVAPAVAWTVDDLLDHFNAGAEALGRDDLGRVVNALRDCRTNRANSVICHGDLHPFNLLVQPDGDVTVIDWTAAILAEPVFDVAFTSMLLANPPLDASGAIGAVVGYVGRRLERRFIRAYRDAAPHHDLANIDWYRAHHGTRMLLEVASLRARDAVVADRHPFNALSRTAVAAIASVTGNTVMP